MRANNGNGFVFPEPGGIYHMSAAGQTTWYEFAKTILEKVETAPRGLSWLAAATLGRPFKVQLVVPVSTGEFGSRTRRPAYSVLSNSRLNRDFRVALPDWRDQLQTCFSELRTAAIPTA
jgi:dTDP-4-dehydrorhamnose reductase